MCTTDTHCKPPAYVELAPDTVEYAGELFEIGWNKWQQRPVYSWHGTHDAIFALTVSLLPFFERVCTHPLLFAELNALEPDANRVLSLAYDDVRDVLALLFESDLLGDFDETSQA